MAKCDALCGKFVALRCADESDAEFTLKIRNDPALTEFIPIISSSVEEQRKWLKKTAEDADDCFFIIQGRDGKPLGTISFYNVDYESGKCELGRYISYGRAAENVEAAVILLDYIFNEKKMNAAIMNCDERNGKIISFWKRFGAELAGNSDRGSWKAAEYVLTRAAYSSRRAEITKLLGIW